MDDNVKVQDANKRGINYATILFFLGIAYLYFVHDIKLIYFLYGSGSWGVGCLLKIILYSLIVKKLPHNSDKITVTATINGFISGISELGAALLFFILFPIESFLQILAFGIGIGAFEALLTSSTKSSKLFKDTELEKPALELEAIMNDSQGLKRIMYHQIFPAVERIIAGLIHIGTRGLALISLLTFNPFPLLLAIMSFTLSDGIIGYKMLYEGKLNNLKNLNKTYYYLSAVALLTISAFLILWMKMAG